jgi:hypothetical protein
MLALTLALMFDSVGWWRGEEKKRKRHERRGSKRR